MIDAAQWHRHNETYLAAALKWLRLRLAALGPQSPIVSSLVADNGPRTLADKPKGRWIFTRRQPASLPHAVQTRTEPSQPTGEHVSEADVAKATAEMQAAEKTGSPPALIVLSQRLGLSHFEQQVVLLCAAMELDTRIAGLCARAQGDVSKPYPTFALALALFDDPAWDALSAERPLRYFRLLEIHQPGAQALTTSALRADERIVSFIKGLNTLDERLAPLLTSVEMPGTALPSSQQAVAVSIVRHIRQATSASPALRLPVIELTGPDTVSKQLVAAHVASGAGLHLYRLPAELLPTHAAELETLARLWQRETLLLPVALHLDAREMDVGAQPAGPLQRFLAHRAGLLFLDTRDVWNGQSEDTMVFDVASPTTAEQQAVWEEELDTVRGYSHASAALLAGQFTLNLPAVHRIAQAALAQDAEPGTESVPLHDRLWEMCLAGTRPRLEALAQRLDSKATWDDLVLPAEAMGLLRQIAEQVRRRGTVYDDWGFRVRMNRGLGISALLAGESGTGKTMAAEVIANDLRLNLYRIDLSAVVSKYIGETEKNLRRLFDAAEGGGAILFFDEADALFGKRSEVKDSHDRYANIEINYLLQRMEAYHGLALLATNMKSALDTAFTRRLRFIVNFPFPGVAERMLMWQKVFPPQTPTGGLDFGRLARFNLTGASIQSIALNAAFLATARKPPLVTMPVVLDAARVEFRKLERPISEAEFK
jgi:hypothetical protein